MTGSNKDINSRIFRPILCEFIGGIMRKFMSKISIGHVFFSVLLWQASPVFCNPIKAVIFDFDGTVANSMPVVFDAYRAGLEPVLGRSISNEEIVKHWHAKEMEIFREMVGADRVDRAFDLFIEKISKSDDLIGQVPGIQSVLDQLKTKYVLAIFTSRDRETTDYIMKRLHLGSYFDVVVTAEDVKKKKPNPDGIFEVIKRLNEGVLHKSPITVENVAMIGDQPGDVLSAKNAKVMDIGCLWSGVPLDHVLIESKPNFLLRYPAELPEVLAMSAMTAPEMRHTVDRYGTLIPDIDSVPYKRVIQSLEEWVTKENSAHAGCLFIPLAFERSSMIPILRAVGFSLHGNTKSGTEWIMRNQCSMPYPSTSIAGGRVFLLSPDKKVLLVEEKYLKGIAMVPGGSNDPGELVKNAAARELLEETGVKVDENDLSLVLLANRVDANRYGANDFNHIFLAKKFSGNLKIQQSEIGSLFWSPLADVASGRVQTQAGQILEVDLLTKMAASHILQNSGRSEEFEIMDFIRQSGKLEADQNKKDLMHIYLMPAL